MGECTLSYMQPHRRSRCPIQRRSEPTASVASVPGPTTRRCEAPEGRAVATPGRPKGFWASRIQTNQHPLAGADLGPRRAEAVDSAAPVENSTDLAVFRRPRRPLGVKTAPAAEGCRLSFGRRKTAKSVEFSTAKERPNYGPRRAGPPLLHPAARYFMMKYLAAGARFLTIKTPYGKHFSN